MRLRLLTWVTATAALLALGSIHLSCGVVENTACAADESCPAGPQGPPGAQGPAGPAGAQGPAGGGGLSFASCRWHTRVCDSGANIECQQVCPAGTSPISGGCDAQAGAILSEHRPSSNAATFPPSPNEITKFDRWVCETSTGNVQGVYALCCPSS